jgi:hypothetical protein
MERLRRTLGSIGASAIAVAFKSPAVASSVPRYPLAPFGGCVGNTGVLRYRFRVADFTAAERTQITARIAEWNFGQGFTGAHNDVQPQVASPPPTAVTWEIRRVTNPAVGGGTDCGNRFIDVFTGNSATAVPNVAAHEVGHAIGLSHDGDEDSVWNTGASNGGGPSIMSTCPVNFDSAGYSVDDRAQVSRRRGSGTRANPGFENTPLVYWRTDVGITTEATASPYSGARYARLNPGGTVLNQRIRLESHNAAYSVLFRYKSNGPSTANYKLNSRSVNTTTAPAVAGCQWAGNWDYNQTTLPSGAYTYRGGGTLNAASGWTLGGTTVTGVPTYAPPTPVGQDIEVSFINNFGSYLFLDEINVS